MSNIWFTSDNHFYHKNILKFCPNTRKGEDYQECAELMIKKWNEMVSYKDTVYCLGDFSFNPNEEKNVNLLRRLNGHKNLILGNHDKWVNEETSRYWEDIRPYREIKINKIDVIMFHYPIYEWNKIHYGSYHLYGHVHGEKVNVDGRLMDVGIDTRPDGDMGLWSWDEVHQKLKNKPIRGHHDK